MRYNYILKDSVGPLLVAGTGGPAPSAISCSPGEACLDFAALLTPDEKSALDNYMDALGYEFESMDMPPIATAYLKFSGILTADAVALVTRFFADVGTASTVAEFVSPVEYVAVQKAIICRMRVFVNSNPLATDTTFTLMQNGVPTDVKVTVPGGATGSFMEPAPMHLVTFNEGDLYDIRAENTAGGAGLILPATIGLGLSPQA